jgi:hypothetical protein
VSIALSGRKLFTTYEEIRKTTASLTKHLGSLTLTVICDGIQIPIRRTSGIWNKTRRIQDCRRSTGMKTSFLKQSETARFGGASGTGEPNPVLDLTNRIDVK